MNEFKWSGERSFRTGYLIFNCQLFALLQAIISEKSDSLTELGLGMMKGKKGVGSKGKCGCPIHQPSDVEAAGGVLVQGFQAVGGSE